ncbi:ATP-binding protein [Paenibacillus durus]|uniref:ATP-binding protein n=1 Tax=Paenibacillus durus TaxID=44251 RepID=UPI000A4AA358|nr:ATP-binding protein [Paenibacillus durus]
MNREEDTHQKKLVDNVLDITGDCDLTKCEDNGFIVSDKGEGINPDLIEKVLFHQPTY